MTDTVNKTAQDVILGALKKVGAYSSGDVLSNEDANDCLDILNGLLDQLSTEKLAVYSTVETVFTMNPGQSSYTVGIGGNINIERPLRIVEAYSRITTSNSPVDFPCDIWSLANYSNIGLKRQPGPWPKILYYQPTYPLANLIFWPVPNAVAEFHMWSEIVLSTLTLTQQLNLPRGYYLFLTYRLAELLAPEYGFAVPPDVARLAKQMTKNIKSLNMRPMEEAPVDGAIVASHGNDAGFIIHGGF